MKRRMIISYKKLWKLLIDKDMMKKELAEKANVSSASIAKLGRKCEYRYFVKNMYSIGM